jgi:hypothetical protein
MTQCKCYFKNTREADANDAQARLLAFQEYFSALVLRYASPGTDKALRGMKNVGKIDCFEPKWSQVEKVSVIRFSAACLEIVHKDVESGQ